MKEYRSLIKTKLYFILITVWVYTVWVYPPTPPPPPPRSKFWHTGTSSIN